MTKTFFMASSTHIVQLIYAMLVEGNLSRILPVVDEQVSIHISERTLFGGVYHGRNGFLTLMSAVYGFTESLSWDPLTYFLPEKESSDDAIVTTGTFRGTLPGNEATVVIPFLHYWLLQNEKVIRFRACHWDAEGAIARLPIWGITPDLPVNGKGD